MSDDILTPTPEEQSFIEAQFTVSGSCGCDGALDDGCPACKPKHRQKWIQDYRALEANADKVLEALAAKPLVRAIVERKLGVGLRLVVCQDWEESERGWGVRPDGFTLHLTREDRDAYVKGYNDTYNNLPSAPDEYTRTSGDPRVIQVDEGTYWKLVSHHADMEGWGEHPWRRLGCWGKGRTGPKAYGA